MTLEPKKILSPEWFIQHVALFVLIIFLAFLYIKNTHYHQSLIRKINASNIEMKNFRAAYITTKASLSDKSMQSQLIDKTEELGLKTLTHPPKKITIKKNEY